MKNLIVILVFLISGLAMAQTTVTLEDQCNCEVLSGTLVTAPGMVNPTGADIGDIYVNTNTGTIYFWDGGSWELTSTDSQQLQGFTFDTTSGELVLTLENGGTASVILPVQTLTTLTLNGNSLEYLDEDNNANTIPLNVGNLALGTDGNSLIYIDEAGTPTNIPLNVGSLTFAPTTRELTYTDEEGTPNVITLPAETLTTMTGTSATGNAIGVYENENGALVTIYETITSISDAGDGNVTLTNETGASVTVPKSDITDNGDGTFTFDNGDGTTVTFVGTDNQNAAQVALSPNIDVDGDSVNETTVQDALTDLANSSSDNQDLTGANLNAGNQLVIGIERGSSATANLSALNETVVAGTGAVTVDDDGSGNYTINSTDPDEDETNELTLVGTGAPAVTPTNSGVTYVDDAAGQLYVYDGTTWNQVGGNTSPDLDPDPTNEIQDLGIAGDQLSITGANTITLPSPDGSETAVTGAGINVVTGSGTTADPYVITATEVDASVTNEVNTTFGVSLGNLTITDSAGTLSVPLASLGSDDQNIDVLTLNATTNLLTVGIEGGADLTVDLSGLVADGSETAVTGAGINVVTGSGTTADPYVITATEVDASVTNEVNTTFGVSLGNLTITDSAGTLSVPLASLGSDDQFDDEVDLRTDIDVDDAGKIPAEVVLETTVQEVIQAIAPITSKAARIFYPPSIAVDASTTGIGRILNLYTQYTAQFATPAVASAGAPAAIPTYVAGDLYYYVTYYDTGVFANVSVDANGVMTYDVIAQPADYNSLINVVFVVK